MSFGGFKKLVSTFYPIIGYIGIALMILLLVAWLRDRQSIKYENYKRVGINHYMRKKMDDEKDFSKEDEKKLEKLIDRSHIDSEQIKEVAEEYVQKELDDEE